MESVDEVVQAAYSLALERPFTHLIAATEKSIAAAGYVRAVLGLPGLHADASLSMTHKRVMKDKLRSAGVPVAKAAQAHGVEQVLEKIVEFDAPVVIKPVFGSLSKDTFFIDSRVDFELRHATGEFDSLLKTAILVEARIHVVREYHCEGIVRNGAIDDIAVSRYFQPPVIMTKTFNARYFIDQQSDVAESIRRLHEQVRVALDLRAGVTHLEVLDDGRELWVGEVAMRPGGLGIGYSWQLAYGIDPWDEFIGTQLGEESTLRARERGRFGSTQLPASSLIRDRALSHPAVVEVFTPEQSLTGCNEVHFQVQDSASAQQVIRELHRIGGRTAALLRPNPA